MVNEGEEEVECYHSNTDIDLIEGSEKKGDTHQASIGKFCVMTNEKVMNAEICVLGYTS